MAGGAGERMRRSGEDVPKPMVAVLGIPLVEWNVTALLRAGITDVALVVAASGDAADQVTAWRRLVAPSWLGRAAAGRRRWSSPCRWATPVH